MAFNSSDWRDRIQLAVAYRMHYRDPKLPRQAAETRIKDFMKYGAASPYSHEVMKAAFEIFEPEILSAAPILRAVVGAIHGAIEREVRNGQEIEAAILDGP